MTLEEALSERIIQSFLKLEFPNWKKVYTMPGQVAFRNWKEQLSLILSAAPKLDGKMWVHFSLAGSSRIPSWEELVKAKEMFLGTDTKAIQVIPPRKEYVNLNPNCLHLWLCLDGDSLPDFTEGTGSL